MFAAAAGFCVAGDAMAAFGKNHVGIALERRKRGAIGREEFLAGEGNGCCAAVRARNGTQRFLASLEMTGIGRVGALRKSIGEIAEGSLEFAAEKVPDAEFAEALFGKRCVKSIDAELSDGIDGAESGNEREREPGGRVHRDEKSDESGFADRGFVELLAGEVESGSLMPAVAEPGCWRGKAEGLAAEFVGGDQEHLHRVSIASRAVASGEWRVTGSERRAGNWNRALETGNW